MKFSALVLRNIRRPVHSVDYAAVIDALLSGGVPLGEVVLVAYDDVSAVNAALKRLKEENDGVFFICDGVLLSAAREAIGNAAGEPFAQGNILVTRNRLYALLSADEAGKRAAKAEAVPAADKFRGRSYHSMVIRTVMAPPEAVLHAVAAVQDMGVTVYMSEEYGAGRVEIVYHSGTPKVAVDEVVRVLASELEPYVYAMEDISVGERLFEALKLHRMKIATAESFTGGGVGYEIVKNPGASKVFYEGLNTYDSGSKRERLGVRDYTLQMKGAVSGDTAYEMAAGLLKGGHCDVAVATTGYAGPTADGSGKAGTCFIAVGTAERVRVFEFHLTGSREAVTRQAINLALFLAYKEIN